MARFSKPVLKLHTEGNAAYAVALVGSRFTLGLFYEPGDSLPADLTGWTLDAKAEVYLAEVDEDGKPIDDFAAAPLTGNPVVPVSILANQTVNPGGYEVRFDDTILDGITDAQGNPVDAVAIDSPDVPIVAVYIRFQAPGANAVIDQARILCSYRRGFGSF